MPYAARVRGGRLAGLSEKGTRVGFPDPWRPAPLRRPGPDPSDLRPGAKTAPKTAPWESLRRPGPDPSDLRPGAKNAPKTAPWESLRRPGPDPSDLRPGAKTAPKTAPWESLRRPGPDPSDLKARGQNRALKPRPFSPRLSPQSHFRPATHHKTQTWGKAIYGARTCFANFGAQPVGILALFASVVDLALLGGDFVQTERNAKNKRQSRSLPQGEQ